MIESSGFGLVNKQNPTLQTCFFFRPAEHPVRPSAETDELSARINACRSVVDILDKFPNFEFTGNRLICTPCSIVETKGDESQGNFEVTALQFEQIPPKPNDLTEEQLDDLRKRNKKFANLKGHVKRHFFDNRCCLNKNDLNAEKIEKRKSNEKAAGMNLGRIIYNIVTTARSYNDYEKDVVLAKLNGIKVGDINHSRKFVPDFLKSLSQACKDLIVNYLKSDLEKTGHRPPISLVADLATFQRVTRQMVSVITVCPDSDHVIQSIPISSSSVPSSGRGGRPQAEQLEIALAGFSIKTEQLVSTAFDGAYFHEKVPEHLEEILEIEKGKVFHCWDPMHKGGLSEVHVTKDHEFVGEVVNKVATIFRYFRWGTKFALLKETSVELSMYLYMLDKFSETRMANHKARVSIFI